MNPDQNLIESTMVEPFPCLRDVVTVPYGLEPYEQRPGVVIDVVPQPPIEDGSRYRVQFRDGSIKAQLGLPDMRLPILYALGYPQRIPSDFPRFSFLQYPELTFSSPDVENFRNLALAFEAIRTGGNMPCHTSRGSRDSTTTSPPRRPRTHLSIGSVRTTSPVCSGGGRSRHRRARRRPEDAVSSRELPRTGPAPGR